MAGRGRGLLRPRGIPTGVILAFCAACAGSGGTAEDEAWQRGVGAACASVDGELAPGASLAARTGRYRVTLVREGVDAGEVQGTIVLTPRASDPSSFEGYSTPLQGIADIELEGVGAHAAGSLDSMDARAPGVLVLEAHGAEPEILLRLGSTANRAEPVAFDEAFTVLSVRRVEEGGGFAGSWRSGVRAALVEGYFCAEPV